MKWRLHPDLLVDQHGHALRGQVTVINFTVTFDGLEEQLLNEVGNLQSPAV